MKLWKSAVSGVVPATARSTWASPSTSRRTVIPCALRSASSMPASCGFCRTGPGTNTTGAAGPSGVQVGEDGQDPPVVVLGRGQVQLGEDAGRVLADGLFRDEQPLCDRDVGTSLGHERQDLALPPGEPADRLVAGPPAEQLGHHLGVHDGAAAGHGADRVDELVVVEHPVLEQVADRACLVGEQLTCVQLLYF